MTIVGIIVTAIALIVGWSAHHIHTKSKSESVKELAEDVEEAAEDVIENQSGIKIDFSEDEDKKEQPVKDNK